ncbi:hypothetical protein HZS_1172 [Henneguya salminicola]|nr:hypothetical protein HZS_1172 [Henneguya salminicola]
MKQADITRKRLKKKASITLSQDHDMHRYFFLIGTVRFCFSMNQDLIFIHRLTMDTLDNNIDAVSFAPPNREEMFQHVAYKTIKFRSHNWSFQQRKIFNIFAQVF